MDDDNDNRNKINVLEAAECWELLRTKRVGRLVTHVGDVVDIFPINYVVDGESIVIRTAEGTKLTEMTISSGVLFEIDDYSDQEAWSVVVRGKARQLVNDAEVAAADQLPLRPMVPTLKRVYVRIEATSVSGRRFVVAEEPPRDGPQDY